MDWFLAVHCSGEIPAPRSPLFYILNEITSARLKIVCLHRLDVCRDEPNLLIAGIRNFEAVVADVDWQSGLFDGY